MKLLLNTLLIITTITACTPQVTQGVGGDKMKRLVTLHNVNPQKDFIEVTVTGHGCTVAEHFDIEVARNSGKCQVSIYRNHFDFCRRMPMPISLKLPWNAKKACGDAAIEIVNPQKPAKEDGLLRY